jgi:hypothetical protein
VTTGSEDVNADLAEAQQESAQIQYETFRDRTGLVYVRYAPTFGGGRNQKSRWSPEHATGAAV